MTEIEMRKPMRKTRRKGRKTLRCSRKRGGNPQYNAEALRLQKRKEALRKSAEYAKERMQRPLGTRKPLKIQLSALNRTAVNSNHNQHSNNALNALLKTGKVSNSEENSEEENEEHTSALKALLNTDNVSNNEENREEENENATPARPGAIKITQEMQFRKPNIRTNHVPIPVINGITNKSGTRHLKVMVPATNEELQTKAENAERMRIAQRAEEETRVKQQQFRQAVNNMYKKAGV